MSNLTPVLVDPGKVVLNSIEQIKRSFPGLDTVTLVQLASIITSGIIVASCPDDISDGNKFEVEMIEYLKNTLK